MLAGGRSFCEIAAALGLSRNTVRRFARATSAEELLVHDGTGRRPSILDEHVPYLHERWNSGCTNAALLWQEIRARGYQGSCRQVRGYLARFRESTAVPARSPAPPKARTVTAWIMTRPTGSPTPTRPASTPSSPHPRNWPPSPPASATSPSS